MDGWDWLEGWLDGCTDGWAEPTVAVRAGWMAALMAAQKAGWMAVSLAGSIG